LSVTTYISTDISAIPLLWIVPLAMYLTTFVLTFARRPRVPHHAMVRVMPYALAALTFVLAAREDITNWTLIALHLVVFFVVSMTCHGELARRRPATGYLTEFYFWLSLGGAAGGIFNALVAPVIFDDVLEYPLTLMAAVLLVPVVHAKTTRHDARRGAQKTAKHERGHAPQRRVGWSARAGDPRVLDLVIPVVVLFATMGLVALIQQPLRPATWPERLLMFGVPILASLVFARRRLRFSLALGAVVFASASYVGGKGTVIFTDRTFFGVNRVMLFPSKTYHVLGHGNTMHGAQSLDPARRREPLTYYFQNGPISQLFAAFNATRERHAVGVVGLGAGSIACYREPGQTWTFYEIDPAVAAIASDPRYFTFLQECAPNARLVLGDGRLSLAAAPKAEFDMLVLDAFSSDAIPIHLLTREALALYLDKLAPGGLVVVNITNRHLALETVVGNLARDAGLISRVGNDLAIDPGDAGRGKMASQWVVMARAAEDLGAIANDSRWTTPRVRPGTSVWTDDFSSLLSVLE
jgi:hypothetical protein